MSKGSWIRQLKRKAMKDAGLTWSRRLSAGIVTGKMIPDVNFKAEGKKIVAELSIQKAK